MLKKAIGESSGGGSDVQAAFALRRDLKVLECRFQLEPAATHVPFGTSDLDRASHETCSPGFSARCPSTVTLPAMIAR